MNPKVEKRVGQNICRLQEKAGMTPDILAAKLSFEAVTLQEVPWQKTKWDSAIYIPTR